MNTHARTAEIAMHDAKAIANHFIDLAASKGEALSPMKIQGLAYFAHGWYLGLTGDLLIDEQVEAWTYGPVIPTLYREFKAYGNGLVSEKAVSFKDDFPGDDATFPSTCMPEIPAGAEGESLRAFLGRIWEVYGCYTAIQLSNLTHEG